MSLADFLFSLSVQRILTMVYARPVETFRLSELLDCAGTGRGNGQRHVQHLLNAGVLIEASRSGHQRAIKANLDFPLYPELSAICRKTFGIVEPMREALDPFRREISEAFVFGSVASGCDPHRSDIDLLVIGTVSILALYEAMAALESRLWRCININAYEPVQWAALKQTDAVAAAISSGPRLQLL
jgi:predicted nucleotidyltransferase